MEAWGVAEMMVGCRGAGREKKKKKKKKFFFEARKKTKMRFFFAGSSKKRKAASNKTTLVTDTGRRAALNSRYCCKIAWHPHPPATSSITYHDDSRKTCLSAADRFGHVLSHLQAR